MTTGDYAVIASNVGPGSKTSERILASIERKSLSDFAASLKDGRHANFAKMIQLRAEIGCRLLLIVEGPAFPADNTRFSRIPYKNIQSAIFHLMMRDNISVILTRDPAHTAKTLVSFVKSMESLLRKAPSHTWIPYDPPSDDIIPQQDHILDEDSADVRSNDGQKVGSDEIGEAVSPLSNTILDPNAVIALSFIGEGVILDVVHDTQASAILTRPMPKSDETIIIGMWTCIKDIGKIKAEYLASRWSIHDLFTGKITQDGFPGAGTMASKVRAGADPRCKGWSIVTINYVVHITEECKRKMLVKIPGITAKTIAIFQDNHTLADIAMMDGASLARIQNKDGNKVGKSKAALILKYIGPAAGHL